MWEREKVEREIPVGKRTDKDVEGLRLQEVDRE